VEVEYLKEVENPHSYKARQQEDEAMLLREEAGRVDKKDGVQGVLNPLVVAMEIVDM
jgi:hypothetical protein